MIALIQRVLEAHVTIDGIASGQIGEGVLILLGVHTSDTEKEAEWLARKCANLRIFRDEDGQMNRSVLEMGGEALVVSQFTLYGSAAKGNRPSFIESARPETALPLYERFCSLLSGHLGKDVQTGEFGADMQVSLVNDGPVTIWLERRADS